MAGEGAPFGKGSPFPLHPHPPSNFYLGPWSARKVRPAGPSLDSLFCGRLPSFFPGLSTLPCHGSALTVREKAVHAKAVCPLILRKSPLANDGSAGSPYAPFPAWLPCVRLRRCRPAACGRWCGHQRLRPCPSAAIACHAGAEIFSQNCRPRCWPDVASPYARLTRSKFYNLIVIFQYVIGLKIFLGKK